MDIPPCRNLIAGNTNDTFKISFETTHLSNYSAVGFKDTDCTYYSYNITANNVAANYSATFEVIMRTKHEGGFNFNSDDQFFTLFEIKIVNGRVVSIQSPKFIALYNTYFLEGSKECIEIINIVAGEKYITTTFFNGDNISSIKKLLASRKDVNVETTHSSWWSDISKETQLYIKSQGITYRTNLSSIATFADCEFYINLNQDGTDYFKIGTLKNIKVDAAVNCNGKTFVPDGFPFYVARENGIFSYERTIKKVR
ncbi:hypothetical protein [Polaribacter sp. IC073]|uniref:hypothetical protein n=1 Tax=Polaribacter sp. IC073 TaxID=2508540 RepID=UPI0011BEFE44|nr:hypothetical protein [Polaribacter sp. IC073]TXD48714.1 hypothetical protein ES045_05690 [Polaribacter sp. IC073]